MNPAELTVPNDTLDYLVRALLSRMVKYEMAFDDAFQIAFSDSISYSLQLDLWEVQSPAQGIGQFVIQEPDGTYRLTHPEVEGALKARILAELENPADLSGWLSEWETAAPLTERIRQRLADARR